jgi:two-component system, cell cycle sensor histidine kinase and response regulator CckA
MADPIRVLFVGDYEADAILIARRLNEHGIACTYEIADNGPDFLDALSRERWDVVLSDYGLRRYSAPSAIAAVESVDPELPFIVVTESIGAEQAADLIRMGARDIVIKSNLVRLDTAIQREIKERRARISLAQQTDDAGCQLGDRKEAERQLVESEQQFRELFENAPVAMARVSHEGKFARTNRAYQELLGYSESELAVMGPLDVMHPDFAADRAKRMDEMLAGENGMSAIENRLIRKDGKSIWALVNAKVMTDPRTGNRFLLAHLQDITARKFAEDQLFQSQKMEALGNLAGGIAHDFNNMLLPIVALTELTKASLPEGDTLRENLDTVLEAADKASKLVKQILTFSRQDQSEKAEIDISRCMVEALSLIKNILPSSITVSGHITSDVGTVLADPAQLHSVVLNLASNAADAMDGRVGEFEITLTPLATDSELAALVPGLDLARNYARIVVRDNGSGMDGQTMERIFNPFFTTKPPGEGTGLGLAMVHGIVERHGRVITVSSELGVGTRFSIYLPLLETVFATDPPADAPITLVPAE